MPFDHLRRATSRVSPDLRGTLRAYFCAKKRVQILKDALPDVQTATMLQLAGVELREQPYDYEAALAQAPPDHRNVLIMPTSPVFYHDRERLADLALRHGIASIFVLREWVDAILRCELSRHVPSRC
jgi:hypothetical protein